jgi:ABC-2 type transport system ATP-binding protein
MVNESNHAMIELRRLHRFFGGTRAVDDVTFEVPRGHVFGYIGPNGAGKTTTMRILATLDLPSAGDAMVDGFSVVNDPDRVRRRLGFMPDYFGVYYNVNCHEYLDFFARSYGLAGKERHTAVERVMSFTGLSPLKNKPISGLSKGMRQRLCLGRSLVHDPSVLVLDEPAAGLDPRARIELREMIRQLADRGKTILVSSHILTELAEMCDSVGIIEQGRLLAVGSVEEIQEGRQTGVGGEPSRQSVVSVKVLADAPKLADWLRRDGRPLQVREAGQTVHFTHSGDSATEADLLRDMVQAGFRVVQYGGRARSLEDVFLEVTEGRVQ